MEQEDNQLSSSQMPVLSRLDRLDRLLQHLEGTHSLSRSNLSGPIPSKMPDKQCKSLSSALEEVHSKGTLMERLTILENRVLQLSLDIDEDKTSRSSSSTVPVLENSRYGLPMMQDQETLEDLEEKQDPIQIHEKVSVETSSSKSQSYRKNKRARKTLQITRYRKWGEGNLQANECEES